MTLDWLEKSYLIKGRAEELEKQAQALLESAKTLHAAAALCRSESERLNAEDSKR